MTFSVFPDPSAGPLVIGPGQTSAPSPFMETAGGTQPAVFLRITMLGTDCEPFHAPHPTLQLQAGTGDPVVAREQDLSFVFDRPGGTNPVARAQLFIEDPHIYAIMILIDRPGSTWKLKITNNDTVAHGFTWVVADDESESAQPWLDLPQTLNFEGHVGTQIVQSIDVHNLGTGFLTVGLGGFAEGSKFQLDQRPEDIAPNTCGKLIIAFNATAVPGTTEELYTAKSNDTHATASAHHNNRVRLLAHTVPKPTPDPCEGIDPFDGGPCRKCPCRRFTPPPSPDSCHPVRGRRCRSTDCGHDAVIDHLPPR